MNTHPMMSACRAPSLSCLPGCEPPVLESVSLRAVLDDLLAQVDVRQVFANREATPIEAVYTFPVPRGAVLLSFTARLGGRELAGRILPAPQAEADYEEAVTDGDAAILLQESSPGLCTVNVGNLLPGEQAELTYRYSQLQYWQSGTLRFTLPTVVAPRYGDPAAAGLQPHQVPEADLFAHHDVEFRAAIRGALQDAEITCPTHRIAVERDADQALVRFDEEAARAMDRDIVLHLRRTGAATATALAEPAAAGGETVGLVSFCPDPGRETTPEPRFVKILVDCSGSMQGDSIGQAREALRRILDSLRPQDHFTIVAFGSTHRLVTGPAVPGTPEAVAAARDAIGTIDASMGGTELGEALLATMALRAPEGRQGDVLLVTDGEVHDAGLVRQARKAGGRVFAVGVGCAPGESLLARLSEATGGAAEFVTPGDDIAGRIHRHFRRLYQPRVRALTVRWPGRTLEERRDREGGLFAGDTVHLLARFADSGVGDVSIRCELEDGQVITTTVRLRRLPEAPAALPEAGFLERLMAAGELRAARDVGEAPSKKDIAHLTALAVRCRLMSPWTSCLMVAVRADGEKSDGMPDMRKVKQMLAAGWHGAGSVLHADRSSLHGSRLIMGKMAPVCASPPRMPAGLALRCSAPQVSPGEWSLAALVGLGVPADVIDRLQRLVDAGDNEHFVCLLALHELLKAGVKLSLGRDRSRAVRSGAKAVAAVDVNFAARVAAAVASA